MGGRRCRRTGIKKQSTERKRIVVTVGPRTGRLIRVFFAVLGAAFLVHLVVGLIYGDITFDGGYAVIEGGHHIHLTSAVGLATGAVVFGTSGMALLLVAYDPTLVVRRPPIFVGLGIALIAGMFLLALGFR